MIYQRYSAIKISITACLSLLLLCGSYANTPVYTAKNPPPKTYTNYCPNPDQLVANPKKMTWSAKGGFRSFDQSFAVKLTKFLGAQWEGVNVGQIICLYHGPDPQTFPVQVLFDVLAITPTAGRWVAKKGHYSNCVSDNPQDCPFWVRIKPKPENIEKVVEGLKSQPVTNPYENQEP